MTIRGLVRFLACAASGVSGASVASPLALAVACGGAAPAPERGSPPASHRVAVAPPELPRPQEPDQIVARAYFRNVLRWAPFLMWEDHGFDINAPVSLLCAEVGGDYRCAWAYRVASMTDALKSADGVKLQFAGGAVSVDNLCLYVPDGTGGARVACGEADHGGAPLTLLAYASSSNWPPPSSEDLYFEVDVARVRQELLTPEDIIRAALEAAQEASHGPGGSAFFRFFQVFGEDLGAFWADVDLFWGHGTMAKDGSVDVVAELEFGSKTSRWTRRLFDSVTPTVADWASFWALPQDAQIAWTTFGEFDWAAYTEHAREMFIEVLADEGLSGSDARSVSDAATTVLGSQRVAVAFTPGGEFSWVVGSLSEERATLTRSFQEWERRIGQSSDTASPALPPDAPRGSIQAPLGDNQFLTLIPTGGEGVWWSYSLEPATPFQLREKSNKGYNLGALTELRGAVPSGPLTAFAQIGFPGSSRAALFGAPMPDAGGGDDPRPPSAKRRYRAELHAPPRWYDSMLTGLIVMFGPGSPRGD